LDLFGSLGFIFLTLVADIRLLGVHIRAIILRRAYNAISKHANTGHQDRWTSASQLKNVVSCIGSDAKPTARRWVRIEHLEIRHKAGLIMRRITLVIAFLTGLIVPAFAQKAEIEAVNAKWMEFFNKGDFTGVASLYTDDATAFPPGSGIVKGRAAIGAMWQRMAEQVSDPKVTTLEEGPRVHRLWRRPVVGQFDCGGV
jgi:hypothetical protein